MPSVSNEISTAHLTETYEELCPQPTKADYVQTDMCIYTEKLEGEKIASRSFRVLKLIQEQDAYLTYFGDINGDRALDRFQGRFYYTGNGVGEIYFGNNSAQKMPATFRTAAGQNLSVGQKVIVHEVYGGSKQDEIASFNLLVGSPYGAQVPGYALVTVQAILKSGEIYNIDQLEAR